MSKICDLLDKLATAQSETATIEAEIKACVPAHLLEKQACIAETVKALSKEIEEKAKYIPESQAHTLLGRVLQLVWNRPTPKLDKGKVTDLITRYNLPVTVADLSIQPPGYWAIRKRGKGK